MEKKNLNMWIYALYHKWNCFKLKVNFYSFLWEKLKCLKIPKVSKEVGKICISKYWQEQPPWTEIRQCLLKRTRWVSYCFCNSVISKHPGLLSYGSGSTTWKWDAGRAAPSVAARAHTPCLLELLRCPCSHAHGLHHTISPLLPLCITFSLWPSCLPLLQISMIMCRAHQDKPETFPAPGSFTSWYLQNHSFGVRWGFTCPRDYSVRIFGKDAI